MRRAAALALATILGGCSFGGLIGSDSVDYNQTYENVTDIGLVTNILRARDHAPLNFSTLSDIRTGITGTGSATETLPIGPINKSTTRGTQGTTLSLTVNPAFEIAPLDTQDFTRGILTPIDPVLVKYYFDRTIHQKLLMYLLFERITVSRPAVSSFGRSAKTAPANVVLNEYSNDPMQYSDFTKFADFVDTVFAGVPKDQDIRVIRANRYTPLLPLGPQFPFEPSTKDLKNLLSLDPSKDRLFYDPEKRMARLYAVSPQPEVVFCRNVPGRGFVPVPWLALSAEIPFAPATLPPGAAKLGKAERDKLQKELSEENAQGRKLAAQLRDIEKSICTSDIAKMTAESETGAAAFGTIYIRSVEGIIQYLGALLRNPEAAKLVRDRLGYSLISLSNDPAGTRFGVNYVGATYYVKDASGGDRTLQVLALLSQLLNLNKVAKEIPSTRGVEIVP